MIASVTQLAISLAFTRGGSIVHPIRIRDAPVIRRLARRREKKIHYRREVIIALCLVSIPP